MPWLSWMLWDLDSLEGLRDWRLMFGCLTQDADQISTDNADADSQSSTPSDNTPSASSTWTNWPNPPNSNSKAEDNRPHTISSAYEKTHNRPALSASLFEPPSETAEEEDVQMRNKKKERSNSSSSSGSGHYARPQSATINKMQPVLPPLAPKPKSKAVPPPKVPTIGKIPLKYLTKPQH
jgi:hypothetical protein